MTEPRGSDPVQPRAGHVRAPGPPARPRASPARRLALVVLHAAEARSAFVNLALDDALEASDLSVEDRALATELAYGVTRWRLRLDYVLGHFLNRPIGELPVWVRNILRIGLYQLLFLGRIPARAAVAESVALAWEFGHEGTAGLVNAVLRQAARQAPAVPLPRAEDDPSRRLAIEFSHPEWLVRRWLARMGPRETARVLTVDNEPAPLTLRANVLRTSTDRLIEELRGEGADVRPGRVFAEAVVGRLRRPLRSLASYRAGLFTVQDESAMAAARAVAPVPGWVVVDACAGLGGKATHLAELMGDRGQVVACDLHRPKLRLLEETAARLGLGSIKTRLADARSLPGSDLDGAADAVLVDAPCSGLGVLRRRPDLRWRLSEDDLASLVRLEFELLSAAAACVRPGGVLVYATCSLEPEENEGVVEGFLEANLEFALDDAATAAGVADRRLVSGPEGRCLAFLPESGGHDGFFVARLVRRRRGAEGSG